MRGPRLERLKETAGAASQPSPTQPSPASPALPSPTPSTCSLRAAKAKARAKSPRTMAKFCQVDGSRTRLVWLVGARVWRAWDAPLRTQHRSGSAAHTVHTLLAGDHIRGCTGPTIRELKRGTHRKGISIQSIFTSERTSRLPAVTRISCHGSAGGRALAWALCIASGHAARPKDTSAISLQSLGRTPALQLTGLHHH